MNYLLFGIILKRYRREKRLTQAQVAQNAGIEQREYIRIESGQNEPRSGVMAKIQRATGLVFLPHDYTTWVTAEVAKQIIGEGIEQ